MKLQLWLVGLVACVKIFDFLKGLKIEVAIGVPTIVICYVIDFSQCFAVVLLFGCITVGVIDIAAPWFSDLKYGICRESFWLNKEQCCWDDENNTHFGSGEELCVQVSILDNRVCFLRETLCNAVFVHKPVVYVSSNDNFSFFLRYCHY